MYGNDWFGWVGIASIVVLFCAAFGLNLHNDRLQRELNDTEKENNWLRVENNRLVVEMQTTKALLLNRLGDAEYHQCLSLAELVAMALGGEDAPVYREREQ